MISVPFLYPDPLKIAALQAEADLPIPSEPKIPIWSSSTPVLQKLASIQQYIEEFQYNYTNKQFVELKKSRGTRHIAKCAKEIIDSALPIQCVEATYIGIYLTSSLPQVVRIPLSFKSRLKDDSGSVFRHMVLVIRYQDKYGAIGISRRNTLMGKEVKYSSLYDLVKEFEDSYSLVGHELLAAYLGLPIPHDLIKNYSVKWKAVRVSMHQTGAEIQDQLCSYASNMSKMMARASIENALPRIMM